MKFLASLIIAFVLSAMFVSLFHVPNSVEGGALMTDCPFMSHEEVICPMSLMEHISTWKAVFLSTVPSIVLVLVVAGFATRFVKTFVFLFDRNKTKIRVAYQACLKKSYSFLQRTFQELFSSGLLNPKLF
jgi:hypothetical protein